MSVYSTETLDAKLGFKFHKNEINPEKNHIKVL